MSKAQRFDMASYYRSQIQFYERFIAYDQKRIREGDPNPDMVSRHLEQMKQMKVANENALQRELDSNPPLQAVLL